MRDESETLMTGFVQKLSEMIQTSPSGQDKLCVSDYFSSDVIKEESKFDLLRELAKDKCLDQEFSWEEKSALLRTLGGVCLQAQTSKTQFTLQKFWEKIEFKGCNEPGKIGARTQELLIDKLKHLHQYSKLATSKDKPESILSFADYYAKSVLNRALHRAWLQYQQASKGLADVLVGGNTGNPVKSDYLRLVKLSLSLETKQDFSYCMKRLLKFLAKDKDLGDQSYAYHVMKRLALELDEGTQDKHQLRAKLARWQSAGYSASQQRDRFHSYLKAEYFPSYVIGPVSELKKFDPILEAL